MTDEEMMIIRERLVRLETKMNILGTIGALSLAATLALLVGLLTHWL